MKTLHIACPACDAMNRLPTARLHDHPVCGRCHKRVFVGEPVVLTKRNFRDQVLRSDLPVLVDFWAPWCGPCQAMAPVLERAARELEPRIRVAKLDTETLPELAGRYSIRSIPTLVVFRQGREIARQSGALGLQQLTSWLAPMIRSDARQTGAA